MLHRIYCVTIIYKFVHLFSFYIWCGANNFRMCFLVTRDILEDSVTNSRSTCYVGVDPWATIVNKLKRKQPAVHTKGLPQGNLNSQFVLNLEKYQNRRLFFFRKLTPRSGSKASPFQLRIINGAKLLYKIFLYIFFLRLILNWLDAITWR